MKNISIIIPVYNEAENIKSLYQEIINNITLDKNSEIIFINDGSNDQTNEILNNLQEKNLIKYTNHITRLGQSRAIYSGVKESKNDIIVTLDGDGQNDPKDILKLLNIFIKSGSIHLIGGIRKKRRDNYIKIFSSKIANSIRKFILNDGCNDTGCGLKIFYKDSFLKIPYFDGIHRFLPALFKGFGYNTYFHPVSHRARLKGNSKYGIIGRMLKGIYDIVRVKLIILKNNDK